MPLHENILAKLAERAGRHAELSRMVADPEVAADGRKVGVMMRELGQLDRSAELSARLEELRTTRSDAEEILADADSDPEMRELAEEDMGGLEAAETELELAIKGELIKDEDLTRRKVIVEIRAGAGGDEATLFASDLFEMYGSFSEKHGWRRELMESNASDVGGFKEIIFALEGDDVWNLMRFESGGHRVQRVPATESQGRTHTSAATVAVLPEAEEVDVEVRNEDLRIDTMRAGGPGGQSVNTTASAVRITHLPSGLVVQCQDEKSQHKNKAAAMRVLRSRLYDAEQQRQHNERAEDRKSQVGSGDRSQRVRTYNYPQNRMSDHRLGENFSLEQIIAGRLDGVIEKLIEKDREARILEL